MLVGFAVHFSPYVWWDHMQSRDQLHPAPVAPVEAARAAAAQPEPASEPATDALRPALKMHEGPPDYAIHRCGYPLAPRRMLGSGN